MNDDRELYKRFLEGSMEAFEELVIKHKDSLIFFVERYIKDFQAAEDIAQEVFASIFVFKEKYNPKYSFSTYIYTIARNKAVDYIRKNKRTYLIDHRDYHQLSGDYKLEEIVLKKEEKKEVLYGLSFLKEEQQVAIYLVDFMDMSYKEAMKIMHKTLPQFKILLYRARKALKARLEKEGFEYEE